MFKVLIITLCFFLNTSVVLASYNSPTYHKNLCNPKSVKLWKKQNDELSKRMGKDHPAFKRKIDYCAKHQDIIESGKCDSKFEKGQSPASQIEKGGPYARCIQDELRKLKLYP